MTYVLLVSGPKPKENIEATVQQSTDVSPTGVPQPPSSSPAPPRPPSIPPPPSPRVQPGMQPSVHPQRPASATQTAQYLSATATAAPAAPGLTGPSGGRKGLTGPSGERKGLTGPSGGRNGLTRPSGERKGLTGPSGERKGLTGPSGERKGQLDPPAPHAPPLLPTVQGYNGTGEKDSHSSTGIRREGPGFWGHHLGCRLEIQPRKLGC